MIGNMFINVFKVNIRHLEEFNVMFNFIINDKGEQICINVFKTLELITQQG